MKLLAFVIMTFFSLAGFGQEITHPSGLDSMAGASGDLDKDGIEERAIVYKTKDSTEGGIERELIIYKKIKGKWQAWMRSRNAILKTDEGGMMGDPFGDITIKNGVLSIWFQGGSGWKWNYTDKYRYQNNTFRLIGHESIYGTPCEYWQSFDYNLLTGRLVYKKEFETCEGEQITTRIEKETFFVRPRSINFQNRNQNHVKIKTPKYKAELYF